MHRAEIPKIFPVSVHYGAEIECIVINIIMQSMNLHVNITVGRVCDYNNA